MRGLPPPPHAGRPSRRGLIVGLLVGAVLVSAFVSAGVTWGVLRESRGVRADLDPSTTPAPTTPSPTPTPSASPTPEEIRVTGYIHSASDTATFNEGTGNNLASLVDATCSAGNPDDPAKVKISSVRLSFTTDKEGSDVVGATSTSPARMVTDPFGRPHCSWRSRFSTLLPEDTQAFFMWRGYTDYYWGPFSRHEATDLNLKVG